MERKILSLAILVFASFLLFGCSKEQNTSSDSSALQKNIGENHYSKMKEANNNLTGSATATPQNQAKEKTTLNQNNMNEAPTQDLSYNEKYNGVILRTNLGNITLSLFGDDAPITCNNFLKLADQKFYDDTRFHRIINDFMIQAGDPNSKDLESKDSWGIGGPGYAFADEINNKKLVRGSLAMANSGPNTNGSQFFIVTKESTPWLDGKHTNFGQVAKGMDVIEKIEATKVNSQDQPIKDIFVESIELLEK